MAQEYIKVLKNFDVNIKVIARGKKNARLVKQIYNVEVIEGGLDLFLLSKPENCDLAIVCVRALDLYIATKKLLEFGVNEILIEKPGALYQKHLKELQDLERLNQANVLIAYNRRFYSATYEAQKIIKEDGGIVSFNFEFTEWSHIIEKLDNSDEEKNRLFISNSSHVVDLAFYLGGKPEKISCFTEGAISWHNSASVFAGAGVTESGALFSYHANWISAGRWGIEILTEKHKLIFRPMEKLQIQNKGTISADFIEIDDKLDLDFKPGIYNLVNCIMKRDFSRFVTLEEQISNFDYYKKIANY